MHRRSVTWPEGPVAAARPRCICWRILQAYVGRVYHQHSEADLLSGRVAQSTALVGVSRGVAFVSVPGSDTISRGLMMVRVAALMPARFGC